MRILVGLGNPGAKYAAHRHNIGFMAADEIHRRHGFSPWKKKFSALMTDGNIGGVKTVLLKPQTFMNLSGQSVGEAMRFYKLSPADVVVMHDELDLAPGKVRVKKGGGHGGHNGLKSTDAHIGKDYVRVRLGIGHPGDKARVNGHVLGDFAKADQHWLTPLIEAIADDAGVLLKDDAAGFMNRMAMAVQGTSSELKQKAAPIKAEPNTAQPRKLPDTQTAGSAKSGDEPKSGNALAEGLRRLFGKSQDGSS
ncbi:MAG: aminoacyl-tRNA hydrolase [Pseudomonadota bacterium]